MGYIRHLIGCLLGALFLASPTAAPADGRLSVCAGPEFFAQSSAQSNVLVRVDLGVDFGPELSGQPVRIRADVGDAFSTGSYSTSGANLFDIGISARTTNRSYFGVGVAFDSLSLPSQSFPVPLPASVPPPGILPILPVSFSGPTQQTNVGLGVRFFAGQKLVSRPGFSAAIEGSYSFAPSVNGQNLSTFGVGLRTSFL